MGIQPRLIADAVYTSADLKSTLKISDVALSKWRKSGLKYTPHGRGAFYVGRDVIDFIRSRAASSACEDGKRTSCTSPSTACEKN